MANLPETPVGLQELGEHKEALTTFVFEADLGTIRYVG